MCKLINDSLGNKGDEDASSNDQAEILCSLYRHQEESQAILKITAGPTQQGFVCVYTNGGRCFELKCWRFTNIF